uniref:ditrans,polycis-polyprenyl diphosphate synthase [(2E,6E)-farnesyldiphosphate specific] n=1 Tax=Anopheles dirus TaxID=7168 RepID=A0A182N0K5_9DIPT
MKPHEGTKPGGGGGPSLLISAVWLLLHTVFTWLEYGVRLARRCRKAVRHLFQPLVANGGMEADRLAQGQQYVRARLRAVTKIPRHLVVLLGPDRPDYRRLAQFIFWSYAAGIEYVSFYDHNGTIKRNRDRIVRCVRDTPLDDTAHIRWATEPDGAATPGARSIHVRFLAPEDGKQGLVQLGRTIGEQVRRRDLTPADVSIDLLDGRLQASSGYVPDPELAMYFGDICSTYGLLPWQIRLTEFLPLDWCLRDSTEQHFVSCLLRYAKCEQRVGT